MIKRNTEKEENKWWQWEESNQERKIIKRTTGKKESGGWSVRRKW